MIQYNARGLRYCPTSYESCQQLWEKKPRSVSINGYITLGNATTLHYDPAEPCFAIRFYSHVIVTFHPSHAVITMGRYRGSPTTRDRVRNLTGARVHSNSKLGYEQPIRIGAYPYFEGIRVDHQGVVLEEDRRPDYKMRSVMSIVHQYTALFRRIERLCEARYNLGEFRYTDWSAMAALAALLSIEKRIRQGETFLPRDEMCALLSACPSSYGTLHEHLVHVKVFLRSHYYHANGGSERVEVKP